MVSDPRPDAETAPDEILSLSMGKRAPDEIQELQC